MTSWRVLCDRSVAECCVALAASALCVGLTFRGERARRVPLFLLTTACLLLFIQPRFERDVERPRPAAILVDDSASMRRGAESDSPLFRASQLASIAADRLRAQGVDVETLRLSGNDAEDACLYESPIYAPFSDPARLDLARFSAVLFFTDGVPVPDLTQPEVPPRERPTIGVAFLGDPRPSFDLRVAEFAPPTRDDPTLRARVDVLGASESRAIRVRLWKRDDDPKEAEVLIDETLQPDFLEENRYALELERAVEISGEPASYLFFVSDPDDDFDPIAASVDDLRFQTNRIEFCYANNGAAFRNDSKDAKIRVLLLDDEPRQEYRYLRETLRRESDVDLTACLLAADSPTARPPEVDPADPVFLARFDVVILGELDPQRRASVDAALDELDDVPNPPKLWLTSPRAPAFPASAQDPAPDDAEWRLDPTPATAWAFGDLSLPEADVVLTDVVRFESLPPDAVALLNARNASTGERVPLLVASRRGRLPALSQATEEFWRLRAPGDKAGYRRFVLGALDYLRFASPRDAAGGVAAPASPDGGDVRDAFEYYASGNAACRRGEAAELTTGRFRGAEIASLADKTGGACLDLRGAGLEEQARRVEALVPPDVASNCETVSRSRALCPPRVGAPVALILALALLLLEALERRRRREG